MKVKTIPGRNPVAESKLASYLLLIPGLIYDLAYIILRPLLAYAAPVAFFGIGGYLLFGVFLDMDRDTSSLSNTVTVLWVAVSALGFSWAAAIGPRDKDFGFVMGVSRRFLHSSIAMVLATGFKFAMINLPADMGLPVFGWILRAVMVVIMACFFTQSMLEAFLPLLKLQAYLSRETAYLPGLTLMKEHLPATQDRLMSWIHGRKGPAGGEAGASA